VVPYILVPFIFIERRSYAAKLHIIILRNEQFFRFLMKKTVKLTKKTPQYLLLINLLLHDFASEPCLKHRILGIAHFVFYL